jgi:hypothetical protein
MIKQMLENKEKGPVSNPLLTQTTTQRSASGLGMTLGSSVGT